MTLDFGSWILASKNTRNKHLKTNKEELTLTEGTSSFGGLVDPTTSCARPFVRGGKRWSRRARTP